jgi:hypothetical protein
MNDPGLSPSLESTSTSQVCDQIGRAVGSLWQRRSGVKPAKVTTEFVGDVVRCTIEEGEASDGADADAEADLAPHAYQLEAQIAVRRLTGRSVTGFIAKPAKSGGNATNAFILDRILTKY